MIKARDQVPSETSRAFRLWHERAIRTPGYNRRKITRCITGPGGGAARSYESVMLMRRLRKLHKTFSP